MSAFTIGESPFRPAAGVTGSRKPQEKEAPQNGAAPARASFDTATITPGALAAMPRLGAVGGQDAQRVQSETVEGLLRDSAAELDDFFTGAYGFGEE